jgi:hypothetical protein
MDDRRGGKQMSRYSDTCDTIKKTTDQLIDICDNPKKVSAEEMLCGIYNILTDIALSLAVIADKGGRE